MDKKVIGSGVESTRKLHEKKLNINETYTIYIYIYRKRERKKENVLVSLILFTLGTS